ncbi:permease [Pelagicoccus sp. SDUM812005]|nr:permease [Pelagicoccus sp. SDUM812005]MDQ8181580.1 permease [Pelagicoccus sp. SDUM812005]
MNRKRETKIFLILAAAFLGFYFLPVGQVRFDAALTEALELSKWYAREHVVLCLLPAFWIAGGIAAFVSQASVMRYLGPKASKPLAYGVGSVSGTILAVCSCTVLPLFAGIYRMGAGLGPAAAFLYSGSAINALAIILTSKVLGFELGLARAIGAIVFSIFIGLAMAWLFRKEEKEKTAKAADLPLPEATRPLWQTATFFATMVGILVFANWGGEPEGHDFFSAIYRIKWLLVTILAASFVLELWKWFGLNIAKLSVVVTATLSVALLVPGQPIWPFLVATLGLAWLTVGAGGGSK